MTDQILKPIEHETLAALADVLIPSAESMPAFSELKGHQNHVERVLILRPELQADLRRALARADALSPSDTIEKLNMDDPQAFGTLGLVASSAYYLDASVRKLLGYPGQISRPASPDEEHDYLHDDILQPVIARGPIYREVPD
ncbi:MAG: hypothetical protein V7723_12205 [Sneathiella sp.]|uniref:hypothetical protein n=1 Tax=Sneathiella sp. TaxID=1964365 RepID=UPI003002134C